MKYPVLYKRSVSGKISTWQVFVNGNTYYTISGYDDGKKITSDPTICHAKNLGKANATTDYQQAEAEAKAMYKKRLELGYFLNKAEVDDPVYFKPMLAHKFEDYEHKIQYPLFSQPKYDGIRCIVKSDGMWTRNGKKIISAPHIFESLKLLFEKDPGLVFDGELYVHGDVADFNTIISCVRKTKPTLADIMESRKIQYWIYDLPSSHKIFSKRFEDLIRIPLPDCCKLVPTKTVQNKQQVINLYTQYMSEGYEGQMLRVDDEYQYKRTKFLLKDKRFIDEEFTILNVIEGRGKLMGKVGKLGFEKDGKYFESAVNGDHEYIHRLWLDKNKLIGKKATVKYFELTTEDDITGVGGVPRFPKVITIRDYD